MSHAGRTRFRASILAALLVTSSALVARQPVQVLPPPNQVPLSERLWLATVFTSNDTRPHIEVLAVRVCGPRPLALFEANRWEACAARLFRHQRKELARLYASPSLASPIVAILYEDVRLKQQEVRLEWTLERNDRPGRASIWPDAYMPGNDYGIHISGVQMRGEWVRLLSQIPVDGWLRTINRVTGNSPQLLQIYTDPLEGQVIAVDKSLTARLSNGRQRPTGEWGSYQILRVTSGMIYFRDEIPSDYACGEKVTDPKPLPPVLHVPVAALFDADGTPRFGTKYTKGC